MGDEVSNSHALAGFDSGRIRSLMTIDRDHAVIEHDQARSSRHFDEGDIEHRLFLREQKSCFQNDRHRGGERRSGWRPRQRDHGDLLLVGPDHNLGRPNVFAQALGENDLDGSHRLLGFGGVHAFDVQLGFERAAHLAHGFVVERRTIGDFECESAGPGGGGDLVGQLAGGVSQARSA